MGLLDSLLGAAMQNMGGGQVPGQAGGQANPLAGALMALLTSGGQPGAGQPGGMGMMGQPPQSGGLAGLVGGLLGGGQPAGGMPAGMGGGLSGGALAAGLSALVSQFAQNGYGEQAKSWVGTGQNMPIAPQAITKVVGQDRLSALAAQYGIPREELAAALAEQLPQAVNELTPQGQVPEPSAMEQMLAQFMGGGRRGGF